MTNYRIKVPVNKFKKQEDVIASFSLVNDEDLLEQSEAFDKILAANERLIQRVEELLKRLEPEDNFWSDTDWDDNDGSR